MAENGPGRLKTLDAFLPSYEFAARHGVTVDARGRFWRLRAGAGAEPAADAVVDFRARDGSLTTETRVNVPDRVSRRRFARYWRVVGPFGGVTPKQILRAAKRWAEGPA